MSTPTAERRLAAVMIADTVGFSRLMEQDEAGTFARLRAVRDELTLPTVTRHGGTVIKTTGDGFLAEFTSAHAAMQAGIAMQHALVAREAGTPADQRIRLRIGIHLGDILRDGNDIAGDGVNITARLEPLAPPDGLCISAAVREQLRDDLGVTFEDAGEVQLKNISRQVKAYLVRLGAAPPAQAPPLPATVVDMKAPVQGFGGRPAIAVLPFDNMSNDPEQAFFADGIAEDILTRLAMWRWLPVIARNSSFVYRGKATDLKAVGTALGARYILEGSVRKAGDRVRVTGQLIDADTGHHVWAERYDRVLADIFDLQDEITDAIVSALEPAVGRAERVRVQQRATTDLTAWEWYQRASGHLAELTEAAMAETKRCCAAAAVADPGFAEPVAMASIAALYGVIYGWMDPEAGLAECDRLAQEAYSKDPTSPLVLAARSAACSQTGRLAEAHDYARRSIEQNPSYARGHYALAYAYFLSGDAKAAVAGMRTTMRLSPNDELMSTMLAVYSGACLLAGEFEESRKAAAAGVERAPNFPASYRALANSLARLGRMDEGRVALKRFLELSPGMTPALTRRAIGFRDDATFEEWAIGLRLLGWGS